MMQEAIKNFPKQFAYDPVIENGVLSGNFASFTAVAMGGSALAADILKAASPEFDLVVHRNYGLPPLNAAESGRHLAVLISYSGNTEEVIKAFNDALSQKISFAVIASGGQLMELARQNTIPYVIIPNTGIQPRMASGFILRALMKIIGDDAGLEETKKLEQILDASEREAEGKALADNLHDKVPVVYASRRNEAIARNWKIKFNETGKIPAFFNILPELNHNEMTGFDVVPSTRALSERFHFIFLKDSSDGERALKRMDVCKKLYEDRGLSASVVQVAGADRWSGIFSSLLIADWTAYHLARYYGVESEEVPMVEEFKKLIV